MKWFLWSVDVILLLFLPSTGAVSSMNATNTTQPWAWQNLHQVSQIGLCLGSMSRTSVSALKLCFLMAEEGLVWACDAFSTAVSQCLCCHTADTFLALLVWCALLSKPTASVFFRSLQIVVLAMSQLYPIYVCTSAEANTSSSSRDCTLGFVLMKCTLQKPTVKTERRRS